MQYLTWRELFELREKLEMTDEHLSEPALFTIQDGYGSQVAYPVHYWTESVHASDGTATLCLSGEDLEMLFPGELGRDEEERSENGEEDYTRKKLRKLPPGSLRLGFSDMDEDFEEAVTWLAQPNPHTPPPVPGPAPLFD